LTDYYIIINNNWGVFGCSHPFFWCTMTFANYLRAKLTNNKLTYAHVGRRTGLHPQSVRAFCYGEYEPRMKNLIALLEVIAESEKRCPRQVLFECLSHIDEVNYAVKRSKKWLNKKESDR
jgi:transcriptional regulator with XRE-family HTH domain